MKVNLAFPLLTLVLAGCASSTPPGPLAIVNQDPVTVADLREQFVKRHGGHEKFLGGVVEAKKFLDIVIDQRLLIQEAYELGLDDTKDVKEPTDAYRERKMVDYLAKSELQDKAVPSKEEIRLAWEKNTVTSVQAREMVVDSKEEAESLRASVLHGAEFETLARQCSLAQSRMHGGLLPAITWGMTDPAFESGVFALEPGELSMPFETPEGWKVVQLVDRTDTRRPDFEKSSGRIAGILQKRKLEQRRREFSDELFAKYRVTFTQSDRSPLALLRLNSQSPEAVIATWENEGGAQNVVLKDAFSAGELRMLAAFPPARAAALVEQRLRQTINEPLLLAEAKARKLGEAPEVVHDVRRFQEDRMEGLLYDEHVLKDVSVSDDEVKRYFEDHRSELVQPERRRIAHIVVATEDDAKALRKRASDGEDFAELAKTKSQDVESAKAGGDLGWITGKDVPAEFAGVLKLQEGDVSEPIQSKFGWHLVKITKIDPERPLTFDQAKESVRKSVLQTKQREKRAYWVKKLRDAAQIRVDDRAVRAFVETSFVK